VETGGGVFSDENQMTTRWAIYPALPDHDPFVVIGPLMIAARVVYRVVDKTLEREQVETKAKELVR